MFNEFGGGFYPVFNNKLSNLYTTDGVLTIPAIPSTTGNVSGHGSSALWGGEAGLSWTSLRNIILGINFAAMSTNAHHTFYNNVQYNPENSHHILKSSFTTRYNIDFTGALGYSFKQSIIAYLKGGASKIKLNSTFSGTAPVPAIGAPNTVQQDVDLWGYTFGIGIAKPVTRLLSIFAEYDYYHYCDKTINDLAFTLLPKGIMGTVKQQMSLSAYTFRVGVQADFEV